MSFKNNFVLAGGFFIIGLLILLSSLSLSTLAFAQAEVVPVVDESQGFSIESQLYVGHVFLDKKSYKLGEDLSGTFSLHNTGSQPATNVRYEIQLVEILEDEGFQTPSHPIDSSELSEPFVMEPGQIGLGFSYKLPDVMPAGNLGILVQLYVSETIPSTYEFIPVEIEGLRQVFFTQNPALLVGDDAPYNIQAGPTIEKEEPMAFIVSVTNTESSPVSLTGTLSIFQGSTVDGKAVSVENIETVTLAANQQQTLGHEISAQNLEPGVYTILFQLKDGTGVVRGLPVEGRFIVAGLQPKISAVTYNTSDFTEVDKFIVGVEYTDVPFNIRLNDEGESMDPRAEAVFNTGLDGVGYPLVEGMSVSVILSDPDTGEFIASETKKFSGSARTDLVFDAIYDRTKIKIDTTLSKGDEIVDVDSFIIPVISGEKKMFDFNILLYGLGAVLLLAIIIILLVKVLKNKNNTNNTIISSLALIIATGSIGLALYAEPGQETEAWTVVNHIALWNPIIHSPKPPSVIKYRPSQNMRFYGQVSWAYCTNDGYGSVHGQLTNPVLHGQPHTGFTSINTLLADPDAVVWVPAWSGLRGSGGGAWNMGANCRGATWVTDPVTQLDNTNNQSQAASVILARGGGANIPRGRWVYPQPCMVAIPGHPYRTRFGQYARSFVAPETPGTYSFLYRMGVHGPRGNHYTSGQVIFAVEDPLTNDICGNIEGVQTQVPVGYIQSVSPLGGLQCLPGDTIPMNCSVSSPQIAINQSVTYTASTVLPSKFTWYSGRSVAQPVIKEEEGRTVSYLTESYNRAGLYRRTVKAENENGIAHCTMNVTVMNADDFGDAGVITDANQQIFVDEDGEVWLLDPRLPNANIDFNLADGLTNDMCTATWNASDVLTCWLYKNNQRGDMPIDKSGTKQLTPGTYRIGCLQGKDGAKVFSEYKQCIANPNLREI
jgi:hypothetical protein